jgi:hypothetical protein
VNTTLAIVGAGAAVALAVGVSGCSDRSSAQSGGLTLTGSKYCTPFKAANTNVNTTMSDPAASFDDCVHRWAYTLAPARDPADVVARASVDACGPILSAWNQQTLDQNPQPPPSRYASRGPQQQQQQNNPLAQRMGMVESRALFYVVQARAAGCAPPPANSLLTTTNLAGAGASS